MRKHLYILLILIFLSLGLTSCIQEDDDTIVIWHDKEEQVIAVLEEELAEKLPDVKVEFVRKESLTDTLKIVGNTKSAAPDMYIFAHDKIGLFSEIGILEPIANLIDSSIFDDYLDLTIDAATYDDTVYQLPLYFETLLFMYNKDRLTAEEVPTTTEELYTYMQENTDSRRYAFVEQHSNAYYAAGWIHGFGGEILHSDGTPGLNDQETIDALTYHLKFLEYMPQGQAEYATVNTLFLEKKANSIIAGPWLVPTAREYGIDLGFAEMPTIDQTGLSISPYAGIQGIQVLKVAAEDETNRARISQILEVLATPEVGVKLALVSGCAPAMIDSYLDEQIVNDELVQAMRVAAENAIPMPNLPEMDVMWTTASQMLVNINLNGEDVLESANEAQQESLTLISNMQ